MEIQRTYPTMTFKAKARRYCINVLIAIDQLCNAILLGDPDETISSRTGKWLGLPKNTWKFKVAYVLCRALHVLDKQHCLDAIEENEGKWDLTNRSKKK